MQIRDRIKELRRVPASELLPNPKNWRTHPVAQQDALRGVLAEVGYADALIARETPEGLMLVDGHLRAETTPDATVPVLVLDINEAESDLMLATLDPLAAMAGRDEERLTELLSTVSSDNDTVNALLKTLANGYEPLTIPEPDPPDEDFDADGAMDDAEADDYEPTVQRGEVWSLGQHRLMCGDATSEGNVVALMDGAKADVVFTSPPYLAQRTYNSGPFDWQLLMRGMTKEAAAIMQPDGSMLVNLGLVHTAGSIDRYWDEWIDGIGPTGMSLYGWYVWDQGWGLPGDWAGRLAPSFEFIFHIASKPRHTNKTEITVSSGKIRNSTFRHKDGSLRPFTQNGTATGDHKVADAVIRVNRQIGPVSGGDHPAVFSVGVPEYCIPIWTEPGDVTYDPFVGSGTTIIAAERLGRRCYAMEIEPRYCDVAIKRWEDYTGQKAVKV
jgi:DNA modification methylase